MPSRCMVALAPSTPAWTVVGAVVIVAYVHTDPMIEDKTLAKASKRLAASDGTVDDAGKVRSMSTSSVGMDTLSSSGVYGDDKYVVAVFKD